MLSHSDDKATDNVDDRDENGQSRHHERTSTPSIAPCTGFTFTFDDVHALGPH